MKNLKKPLKFTLCMLPFAAAGGWFAAQYALAGIDAALLEEAVQQFGSTELIVLLTAVQSMIMGLLCAFFGYIIAEKLGLIRPFRFGKKETLVTVLITAICGVVFSADAFTFAKWIPEIGASYESTGTFDATTWLASFLYGGVIEEVMLRLFFMSLVALIVRKLFCKQAENTPDWVLITANIIAALAFSAGHLPATVQMIGPLTPLLVLRCFLLNGAMGLVFGRFYRKYGLQYAMLSHIIVHLVSRTIWLIVF